MNLTAAFLTTTVQFDECEVRLEIWDTAGQDRFHCLAPMFYRGSKACVVAYDITRQVCHLPTYPLSSLTQETRMIL